MKCIVTLKTGEKFEVESLVIAMHGSWGIADFQRKTQEGASGWGGPLSMIQSIEVKEED